MHAKRIANFPFSRLRKKATPWLIPSPISGEGARRADEGKQRCIDPPLIHRFATPEKGNYNNRGFTLIEILVVIVIVGITLSFALLAFGDFGAGRKAVVTAEQLAAYIKLVQQRAILEVNTLGININSDGYETLRFEKNLNWQAMPKNSLFHWQNFPKNVVVIIKSTIYNRNKRPDIIINPSGDMSPFTIQFGTESKANLAMLYGQHNGELILKLAES